MWMTPGLLTGLSWEEPAPSAVEGGLALLQLVVMNSIMGAYRGTSTL